MTTTATTVDTKEHKVFIGNLSFKTSKEVLTSFAESTGKVLETTIITRGTRSLGYGFVTFESESEACRAAQELNHKELEGREINVEVARPKTESPVRKTRKLKRNTRRNKKVVSEGEEEPKKKKRSKKEKKAKRETEPSKTILFVANLPYATTDDGLKSLFADYKVVSAHIARMKNGNSKGYGFVEMADEQEQAKALHQVKDVILEGRSIYLKVALSEIPSESDHETAVKTDKKDAVKTDKKEAVKTDKEVKKEAVVVKETKEVPVVEVKKVSEVKKEVPVVEVKKAAEVKKVTEAKKEVPVVEVKKVTEVKKEVPVVEVKKVEVKKDAPVAVKTEAKTVEVKKEATVTTKTEVKSVSVNASSKAVEVVKEVKPTVTKETVVVKPVEVKTTVTKEVPVVTKEVPVVTKEVIKEVAKDVKEVPAVVKSDKVKEVPAVVKAIEVEALKVAEIKK